MWCSSDQRAISAMEPFGVCRVIAFDAGHEVGIIARRHAFANGVQSFRHSREIGFDNLSPVGGGLRRENERVYAKVPQLNLKFHGRHHADGILPHGLGQVFLKAVNVPGARETRHGREPAQCNERPRVPTK
jgi:hypothetical protein